MKHIKLVGLALVVAMALTALLGAGSASAAGTVLCDTNAAVPHCPPGQSSQLDLVEASSTEASILVNGSKMKCTTSSLVAATAAQDGQPLDFALNAWSLSNCKLGGIFTCTATTVNVPGGYAGEGTLSWTENANGVLSITDGGGGNPGWHVVCPAGEKKALDCTYTFEPSMDISGGSPAGIVASTEPMSQSGSTCVGVNPTFSATYTVTAPAPAYVTQAFGQPKMVKTALCSANESPCPEENIRSKGTKLEAQSSDLTIDFDYAGAGVTPPITCKTSKFTGELSASTGEPLPIKVNSWMFEGCHTSGIKQWGCTLEGTGFPYEGALTAFPGSGNAFLGLDGPAWRTECNSALYFPVSCNYRVAEEMSAFFDGGAPTSITIEEVPVEEVSGTSCLGDNYSLSGTFTLTSPSPAYAVAME